MTSVAATVVPGPSGSALAERNRLHGRFPNETTAAHMPIANSGNTTQANPAPYSKIWLDG